MEDTSALFFLRYLLGEAGEMGKVSRDLPQLRTLPTFWIRQSESKMEGDLAKEEKDREGERASTLLVSGLNI